MGSSGICAISLLSEEILIRPYIGNTSTSGEERLLDALHNFYIAMQPGMNNIDLANRNPENTEFGEGGARHTSLYGLTPVNSIAYELLRES